MTITYRIVLALLTLSLAACSGISSSPPIEIAAPRSEATLEAVEFPPTWTPTSIPTQVPATETPQASTNLATPGFSNSLPALNAATPVPASISIANWQKVEGATATFYLPRSFEVLDLGSEFGLIMATLMTGLMEGMVDMVNELGEELGADPVTPTPMDMSELEAAFNIDFVLALEDNQKTSAFLFSEPLEETTSLEEQMQATLEEPVRSLKHGSCDGFFLRNRPNEPAGDRLRKRGTRLRTHLHHPARRSSLPIGLYNFGRSI
jgi:hypothetical protein